MFLRIVRVRSTEQSGIKGVKIPFDPNILYYIKKEFSEKISKNVREDILSRRFFLFIYASNEPKSVLARDLDDCRDNG